MAPSDRSILIIGGGTFGLSTALHLSRAGYTRLTVLEKAASIPSPLSAANDLNKIVRAEYEDAFYAALALQAMGAWQRDPLFAPHFHLTGYLLATSAAAPEKSRRSLARALESIRGRAEFEGQITPLLAGRREDVRAVAPALDGPMEGWQGYFNRRAGYASAADALRAVYEAVVAAGVDVRLGEAVEALTYEEENGIDSDGAERRCTGAVTASGRHVRADVVVLTLGASLARVLPRIGRQVTARAWSIAQVQLTPEEAERLAGIPVTYARDIGFFFEPDRKTRLLKISPSGAGYTNCSPDGDGISLPPEQNDFIPARDEEAVRKLLRETLPALAERPLVGKKICWCADSAETDYVIDFVPGHRGLVAVTGDSGHGFKMFPIAGQWVKDVIERGAQDIERWRWKEGKDAGQDVSWRIGKSLDLHDVSEISR